MEYGHVKRVFRRLCHCLRQHTAGVLECRLRKRVPGHKGRLTVDKMVSSRVPPPSHLTHKSAFALL